MSSIVLTLGISLLIQAIFFAFAASLKTDKVTDLSYSLSFIALALLVFFRQGGGSYSGLVLALMVVVWGLRLGLYLLYRIVRIKRDPRFDGIRENFLKFLRFWLFQGIVVWVIMLPVTAWFEAPGPWNALKTIGMVAWFAGLTIETIADIQKFRQKQNPTLPTRWVSSGLWRYSRHPNYFGEMLCWWGVFIFTSGELTGWSWMTMAGPVTLTYLLLYVTGIPTLERSAEQKWGEDPAYREYRRTTRLLIPWPVAEARLRRS